MKNKRENLTPIKIQFENDHYVVFEKPAGLLVIPTPKGETNTLTNIVGAQYRSEEGPNKLYPCHRLDRETSGLILYAKSKTCQKKMMDQFRQRQVKKVYVAFVHGQLAKRCGEIRRVIVDLDERKFRRYSRMRMAVTKYKVLKTHKSYSVIEVEPVTGRTNQIRIHFSQMGHPLVGERKYAVAKKYSLKFRRVALHASYLHWSDPFDNQSTAVTSQLPKDMEAFLAGYAN